MALRIDQRDKGSVTILDLTGKLAGDASDTLAETIGNHLKVGRTQLVLNLARVTFVDSGALAELLSLRSRVMGEGGQLKLLNLNERISDLLVTTKLEMVFETFESDQEATESFS